MEDPERLMREASAVAYLLQHLAQLGYGDTEEDVIEEANRVCDRMHRLETDLRDLFKKLANPTARQVPT